jgi:hypothetical protein
MNNIRIEIKLIYTIAEEKPKANKKTGGRRKGKRKTGAKAQRHKGRKEHER